MEEDTPFRKKGEPTGEWDVFYSDGKEGLNEDPWFVALAIDGAPGSTEANARLIAAAPELYEALDAIVCYLLAGDFKSASRIAEGDGLARLARARGDQ